MRRSGPEHEQHDQDDDRDNDEADAVQASHLVPWERCRRSRLDHRRVAKAAPRQSDGGLRPPAAEIQARAGLAQVDADAGCEALRATEAKAHRMSLCRTGWLVIWFAAVDDDKAPR